MRAAAFEGDFCAQLLSSCYEAASCNLVREFEEKGAMADQADGSLMRVAVLPLAAIAFFTLHPSQVAMHTVKAWDAVAEIGLRVCSFLNIIATYKVSTCI